ncbi:hypothetical protein D3C87_1807970 [compost metagenome]
MGDFLCMLILSRPAGAFGIAEANAAVTVLRLDFSEEERHFRQRLLSSGEHFRIADRRLQWQEDRRQLDPGNTVGSDRRPLRIIRYWQLRVHVSTPCSAARSHILA